MFVLGGAQSDFARHLAREGTEISELVGELVDAALADAGVRASDIQTIHVGNAFGQLFTGQGHLGAMPATVRPALWGVPAMRHEAACASGSMAILAAMAELEAGRYDCALVLGVEQERNVGGELAAKYLGAAAWVGHEAQRARYVWPHLFSQIGDAYASLRREHLVAIAEQALANARDNPNAQTRGWTVAPDVLRAEGEDARNPIVEGRLRRYDCAQVTDGGAAVILASPRFGRTGPRILGWGHRTVGLPLVQKLERREGLLMPHLAGCVDDARRRAGLAREQIRGYEIHDCFTTTQYLAIDHLGLAPPGESWRAIESGATARTGATPINPGGGLIGGGHPVGATGVRMVLDAARQVAGRAGAAQLAPGPIQTLNLGGSAATVASFVVGVDR
ncbi:MAG TPA: acetyl-CoA acetyltransferase [Kofleriaceae bacterium]|jgi:acetyl-CoA C-acetyltransferase